MHFDKCSSCAQFFIGFSPLFIALHRRHWETAKLVLAIATAQYNPIEVKKIFSNRDLASRTCDIYISDVCAC